MICPNVPEAAMTPVDSLGRIAVAQHGRQRKQTHGHNSRTHNACGRRQETRQPQQRDTAKTTRQRSKDPRHSGQQIVGNLGAFKRDAHQNEHQNRKKRFDRLPSKHTLVHAVHDKGNVAVKRRLPSHWETRLLPCAAIGISEIRHESGLTPN